MPSWKTCSSERPGMPGSPGFSREGHGRLREGGPRKGVEEEREGGSARRNPQDPGGDGGGCVPWGQGGGESPSPAALGPRSPGVDGSGNGLRNHTPEGILTSRCRHLQPHLVLELRPGVGFELAGGGAAKQLNNSRSRAPACEAAFLHLERSAEARAAGRVRQRRANFNC